MPVTGCCQTAVIDKPSTFRDFIPAASQSDPSHSDRAPFWGNPSPHCRLLLLPFEKCLSQAPNTLALNGLRGPLQLAAYD